MLSSRACNVVRSASLWASCSDRSFFSITCTSAQFLNSQHAAPACILATQSGSAVKSSCLSARCLHHMALSESAITACSWQRLARDTHIIGAECLEACTYHHALSFTLVMHVVGRPSGACKDTTDFWKREGFQSGASECI